MATVGAACVVQDASSRAAEVVGGDVAQPGEGSTVDEEALGAGLGQAAPPGDLVVKGGGVGVPGGFVALRPCADEGVCRAK
jgi:hypothetical protein